LYYILFYCSTLECSGYNNNKKNIFEQSDKGGYASLIFNQISFLNWAKGGENTVSATGIVSLFAKLKKERFAWENTVDLRYGLQNS
jgi:hypothetical protein